MGSPLGPVAICLGDVGEKEEVVEVVETSLEGCPVDGGAIEELGRLERLEATLEAEVDKGLVKAACLV
jgi:hypothetical protein